MDTNKNNENFHTLKITHYNIVSVYQEILVYRNVSKNLAEKIIIFVPAKIIRIKIEKLLPEIRSAE